MTEIEGTCVRCHLSVTVMRIEISGLLGRWIRDVYTCTHCGEHRMTTVATIDMWA